MESGKYFPVYFTVQKSLSYNKMSGLCERDLKCPQTIGSVCDSESSACMVLVITWHQVYGISVTHSCFGARVKYWFPVVSPGLNSFRPLARVSFTWLSPGLSGTPISPKHDPSSLSHDYWSERNNTIQHFFASPWTGCLRTWIDMLAHNVRVIGIPSG